MLVERGILSKPKQSYQDAQALGAVMAKYGIEMGMGSILVLVERHGLVSGEAPQGLLEHRRAGEPT
jgi:hypothetical protein